MPKSSTSFQKGVSGNPKGRPKVPEIQELREAIKEVEKTKKRTLMQHFVDRAYKSDAVLAALQRKIVPDLSSVDSKSQVDGTLNIIINKH